MQQLIQLCKTSGDAHKAAMLMCELMQRSKDLDTWGKGVVSSMFSPLYKPDWSRGSMTKIKGVGND